MNEQDPLGEMDITVETLRAKMERTGTSLLHAVASELIEIRARKNLHIMGQKAYLTPDTVPNILRITSYTIPLVILIVTADYIATNESRLPKLLPLELLPRFSAIEEATAILRDASDVAILKEDPSGFLLLDRGIERLENPSRIMNESMKPVWNMFLEDMRQAGDHYKKFYLIGAQAGLGPPPKNISREI